MPNQLLPAVQAPATGFFPESYRFKDLSHEKLFGAAPVEDIKPLNRDTSGIPVIFQGTQNTCVSCTLTWIRQWMEKDAGRTAPRLSWPFLAQISNTGFAGAAPSQVLEPARKQGIAPWEDFPGDMNKAMADAANFCFSGYSLITNYSRYGLYAALKRGPLAIGVLNFKNIGDHFMAAYDVTEDGTALKCKNWWNEDEQTEEIVPFADVEVAYSFASSDLMVSRETYQIHFLEVLVDMVKSYFKYV
jgi:hypothetical protein